MAVRPRISIQTFAIVFLLSGLTLAAVLIWTALDRLEGLSHEAKAHHHQMAADELDFTLRHMLHMTEEVAVRFTEWDEVIQQFTDRQYYLYWRENRASQANFVPHYFDNIELYDANGVPLAEVPHEGMPLKVTPADLGLRVTRSHGYTHLAHVSEILTRGPVTERLGYMVIELDFTEALESLQKFRYVDLDSVSLNAPVDQPLTVAQVLASTEFETLPASDYQRFHTFLVETLSQLGGLAGLLGLLLFYLLVSVVAVPLRTLAGRIGALKEGDAESDLFALTMTKGPLQLSELERLGRSVADYHGQLARNSRTLRDREARLRAVLEHAPNGIILLNGRGEIQSINPAAEQLFGYWPTELIGRPFEALLDTEARPLFRQYMEEGDAPRKRRSECRPIELSGRQKDGERIDIDLTVNQLDLDEEQLFIIVVRDISEQKRSAEKLEFLANYDPLTHLPNRALFRDRLVHALAHAHRDGGYVGLIFIDLDQFKRINDTLGHHIGDQLLQEVARRLSECIREADTVARLGGDEFTVILEGIEHPDDSATVAEKIIEALAQPFSLDGTEVVVTPSLGITTYPTDDTDVENLLKNADTAMYRAKEGGGNAYEFFTAEMNRRLKVRVTLEGELRRAFEQQEFFLVYQPRVNLETGEVTGVEALLRWDHPSRGIVSPAEFIPVLEETGLIIPVGHWVLQQACRQAVAWDKAALPAWRMAVNLSARQFRHDDLVTCTTDTLQGCGLEPGRLELEITEGLLIENVESASSLLDTLTSRGVHVSIDDFGTGYSSLSYLKRFPISTLKVDQSFVRNIDQDSDNEALAKLVIEMAHTLGMNTIAEGVETEAEMKRLRQFACDEVQGFLIGRPMTPTQLVEWYISREAAPKARRRDRKVHRAEAR